MPKSSGTPDDTINCFPFAAGRYPLDSGSDLDPPFHFGWMQLNLNFPEGFLLNPEYQLSQSHVTVAQRIPGFEVGHSAVRLLGACEDANPILSLEWPIPFF